MRDIDHVKTSTTASAVRATTWSLKAVAERLLSAARHVAFADRASGEGFAVIRPPVGFAVGLTHTLSALSIHCAAAAGPVTVTPSAGPAITLRADGVAPGPVAGDGVFTGTWRPTQTFGCVDISSPAGSERIGAPDLVVNSVSGPVRRHARPPRPR